jgi:hypothetical protein
MNDEDRQALHEILGRGEGFGHRQHVELAWCLLDLGLLGHFYSPGLLTSAEARGQRVAPDRHPLPALSPG